MAHTVKATYIVLFFVFLFGLSSKGYSMSFFDIGKVCLFSETHGEVVLNGKPVSNAKVIRSIIWQHETIEDEISTKQDGSFHFAPKFSNTISKFLPGETVISQEIKIYHESKEYEAWITTKRDYEENSELNGKPLNLVCDLADESTSKEVGVRVVLGICRWE